MAIRDPPRKTNKHKDQTTLRIDPTKYMAQFETCGTLSNASSCSSSSSVSFPSHPSYPLFHLPPPLANQCRPPQFPWNLWGATNGVQPMGCNRRQRPKTLHVSKSGCTVWGATSGIPTRASSPRHASKLATRGCNVWGATNVWGRNLWDASSALYSDARVNSRYIIEMRRGGSGRWEVSSRR